MPGDPEQEQDGVQERHGQRGVGRLPDDRLGVEGDPEARGGQHVQVVGSVADRHRLLLTQTRLGGEAPECCGLRGPVHDLAEHVARQVPVDDLELVGEGVVEPELGDQVVGDHGEAATDDAHRPAQPLQGPDQRAGAGGQPHGGPHPVDRLDGEPGEQGDPGPQRGLEVQLTGHRGLGHAGDLLKAACLGGQQLDHLALHEGRVDVKHDQAGRAAEDRGPLHRHVDLLQHRLGGQGGPQRSGVAAGDQQFVGLGGEGRQALDPLDVGAARGQPTGDAGERCRRQGHPQHHDVVADRRFGVLCVGQRCELHVHAQAASRAQQSGLDRRPVAVTGDDDPEQQAPVHHHLLDVEDRCVVQRQDVHEARGHAGRVPSGHGDQQAHVAGPAL